ncbi:TonB-dependent siderophore receptor [Azotobacter vinelandii CA]|uniref:TonB-dependent siderophore receptor n=2 Tax=Azotobacter vinelandii TaxID=354 RepID=C1DQ18_AZOVD|nr:TonB-dependent siderophore receptor [Azotobacter vinelandii]ACO77470.1 TonB-dependent siderophore receptor [Azotobacter vinelandii DJ]AGK15367.1 TonB-dependent siderophore receptor [Azotobacter vinelandii CA]AGK19816.1 TonB-dependent siderophore receptor [Azotobacter vinelandii CA6]WKN23256.1 TonB-dependent siderophore receptor [Azotobacter vinelandii]SFX49412.1 catecholate siderophore receptor [Azotobacter vinelandii]
MSRINERPAATPRVLASALGVMTAFSSIGGLRAEEVSQKKPTEKDAEKQGVVSMEADSIVDEREGEYKVESASKKFTAPLRETPKSVTIISKQVIEDTGSLSLVDALRTTSGITFGAGEGGNPAGDRPIIRGFNAESDTFIDGLRDVASQTREIFNIEQIEVSKGPGSAYTGAGSTGGSVNMITKTAKRNDFLDISQTFGSDQTRRSTLDFNRMLSDQIGFRLNLMKHDANVAGRDGVDVSRWGVAPTITFGFDTPTRATFSYYHVEADDMPDYGIPLSPSGTGSVRRPVGHKDAFYGLSSRDFRESSTDSGTFRIEHDLAENVTISNSFRQVRTTLDYIATNPNDSAAGNIEQGLVWRSPKSRNSTSEGWVNQTDIRAKFKTGFIEHTMVGGIEITDQDVHNRPYAFTQGAAGRVCSSALLASGDCTTLNNPTYKDSWSGYYTDGLAYTDTDTQTKSGYLFDTLKFNDQWSLNLGLRYDDFETKSSGYSTGGRGTSAGNFKYENNNNFWSHQLGVVYNPLPNGSIYVAWSTSRNPVGETSGEGSDSIATATQDLEPERNRNIELGTKWEFFDGRLALDSAIFKTKKSNARVTDQDGRTQNMGEVEIKGFELGVSGRLSREWQIFANYTYLDSEIVNGGVVNGVDGANDGNENPSTPENSFSFWSTYQLFPFLTVGGGANYVDSRYGDAANTALVSSYWRYDAMANLKVSKNLDLQLNVQNLTDKRYFDQIYPTHMAHVAPGRTVLLATNLHF